MMISATAGMMRHGYVCYSLTIAPEGKWLSEPFYWGAARLSDAVNLSDADKNSEWRRLIKNEIPVYITVDSWHETLEEARKAAYDKVIACRPTCDIFSEHQQQQRSVTIARGKTGGKVRCIETDITYPNASQAAKSIQVSTSAMSNHLNRKPYYNTIRGYTYERVE